MEEIEFINNTEPALNATNLNKLQKNIKPHKYFKILNANVSARWKNYIASIL